MRCKICSCDSPMDSSVDTVTVHMADKSAGDLKCHYTFERCGWSSLQKAKAHFIMSKQYLLPLGLTGHNFHVILTNYHR